MSGSWQQQSTSESATRCPECGEPAWRSLQHDEQLRRKRSPRKRLPDYSARWLRTQRDACALAIVANLTVLIYAMMPASALARYSMSRFGMLVLACIATACGFCSARRLLRDDRTKPGRLSKLWRNLLDIQLVIFVCIIVIGTWPSSSREHFLLALIRLLVLSVLSIGISAAIASLAVRVFDLSAWKRWTVAVVVFAFSFLVAIALPVVGLGEMHRLYVLDSMILLVALMPTWVSLPALVPISTLYGSRLVSTPTWMIVTSISTSTLLLLFWSFCFWKISTALSTRLRR
jgi:hypothetical protein